MIEIKNSIGKVIEKLSDARASERTQTIAIVALVAIAIVAAVGIGAYALLFQPFGRGMMVGPPGWGNMQGWGGHMGSQCCATSGGEPITEENAPQIIEEENTLAILNYEFDPESITIKSGTTITWINLDVVAHTVDAGTHENPADLFESGSLKQKESFSYTFIEPGVYVYHCDPHPYMEGVIIVEA